MGCCTRCGGNERQKGGNNTWCRACIDEKSKQHRQKNRDRVSKIKLQSGCQDCGYDKHPSALDFDHVRGEKKLTIGASMFANWNRLKEEIAKCDVVCANCHRIRTHEGR